MQSRGSAPLAARVELAGLLVEMIAERLERLHALAGAGLDRQPAAGGSLLAKTVRALATRSASGIIVKGQLRAPVSNSGPGSA
jgi:hypothetical protein